MKKKSKVKWKLRLKKAAAATNKWVLSARDNKLAWLNISLSIAILLRLNQIEWLVNQVGETLVKVYVNLAQNDGLIYMGLMNLLDLFKGVGS